MMPHPPVTPAKRVDTARRRGAASDASRRRQSTQRTPRVRFLAWTLLAVAVVGAALVLGRQWQVRRMADSLRQRGESLASEKRYADAASYFQRYLQMRPDDPAARVRLAEVYDLSGASPRRAVELYQSALGAANNSATPESKLAMQTRVVELLLEGGMPAAAESEADQLARMERETNSGREPAAWRAPSLKALALFGQFQARNAAVSRSTVERGFQQALEPAAGEPVVYKDPRVYLARYEYRRQQGVPSAEEDLRRALQLAPQDVAVVLAAATTAHQKAAAEKDTHGMNAAAKSLFREASGHYDRAIALAPTDTRGYFGLGQLLTDQGDLARAIETWQAGLKAAGGRDVAIHLCLADAFIQTDRTSEAEAVLQSLDQFRAKLRAQTRIGLQPLVDLRRGQIALRRGDYLKAISLVAEFATDKEASSSAGGRRAVYQAWLVLGAANAGLKRWDQAIAAFEQAIAREPRELTARMSIVAACIAAGRNADGIRYCQQTLTAANALARPVVWERQLIYQQLIALLELESRTAEAARYRELRINDIADSAELTERLAEEQVWH
ncbi:MAG: tetratricopeptide repeat protein [Thermoguttaceae bacterium]